eukprot:gene16637-22886_t
MTDSSSALDQKIRTYEVFLNEVLREDLKKQLEIKGTWDAEINELEDLKSNIDSIKKEGLKTIKSQVELGADVFVQAKVADTSRIFINVGLGFHVECTLDEAPRVVDIRVQALQAKKDGALSQVAKIKAHIRLVEEGIRELMQLPSQGAKKPARGEISATSLVAATIAKSFCEELARQ